MHRLSQWMSCRALKYLAVGTLACGLAFTPACTSGQEQTTIAAISAGIALADLIIHASDPTSGANLASLDVGQSLINLSLSDATIHSTSGTGTVTVTDASTGSQLGQQSFNWYASGNSIYAQNPTTVHDWLQQFSGYSSVDVDVKVEPEVSETNYGTVSATDNVEYQGATYASATASWSYTNPKQLCNPSPCRLSPKK